MSPADMTLGRRLRLAREEAGLTMRQLAERVDIPLSVLHRLSNDEVQDPKPAQLIRLAEALELNAAELFLLANVPVPTELPTVEALLRSEYDLPEAALREARRDIEAIVARYKSPSPKREEESHEHP